ncbi:GNA1-like protein [Mya arenaria]|uniref:Glucosamine 6-phosphate N-acetyltransferase n=2 Tax=Mya arenaria TaxID=6604 RepID=A0ABY7FFV4_MYAAR|nr:GNA1-like protein [Mya arenaria]
MSDSLTNGESDVSLFDGSILKELDFSECLATYKPTISHTSPGENLIMRPLQLSDYEKGYMKLLTHLTVVGDVTKKEFEDRFCKMRGCADSYYVVVVEDTSVGKVIGSVTLAVEQKFIRQCSSRARVEDVVVDDEYRGKQLGKLLLDVAMLLSKKIGCYKVSLECKDKLVPFYEQFGYVAGEQNYMV